jgi:hypothetical protein
MRPRFQQPNGMGRPPVHASRGVGSGNAAAKAPVSGGGSLVGWRRRRSVREAPLIAERCEELRESDGVVLRNPTEPVSLDEAVASEDSRYPMPKVLIFSG